MRPALVLLLLLGWTAPAPDPDPDRTSALREGNRRFHDNDLEGAMAAYAAGYDGDPLLAYNLGTVAHHLERFPEALLWYRRAQAAHADHPWLRDNLELVREQLQAGGAQDESEESLWSFWMDHRDQLLWTGIILAWTALPAALVPRSARARRIALAAVAVAAGLPFAAGLLLAWKGPQDAVLLQDCGRRESRLPAGSEVRVFPTTSPDRRGWRIPGSGLICPDEAVGLVAPPFRTSGISAIFSDVGPKRTPSHD